MKNLIYILFLVLLLSSCSATLQDIPKNKMEYVKSVVICDLKATNFKILNQDEVVEFFESENEFVVVKYASIAGKKSDKKIFIGEREVKILRKSKDRNLFYISLFKRKTFPFSDCRKLKTEPKYFK